MSLSHNSGVRNTLSRQRDRYRVPPSAEDARSFTEQLENQEAVRKPSKQPSPTATANPATHKP